MASERRKEEKVSFMSASARRKGYGTARSSTNSILPIEAVRHEVCEGDTLEGLSVRYGVPVEKIRQENKLWAADSIFSRQHLTISIPRRKGEGKKSNGVAAALEESTTSTNSSTSQDSVRGEEAAGFDQSSVSANSFFARFDSDLARTRSTMDRIENTVDKRIEQLGAEANQAADAAAEAHFRQSKANPREGTGWSSSLRVKILGRLRGKSHSQMENRHDEMFQL